MDMSIHCIDYREPLLWVSTGLGTCAGVLIGRRIVTVLRRKAVSRSALVALTLFSIPLAIVLSYIVLALLYAFTRGGFACAHFVRPALFAPGLLCAADMLVRSLRSDASACAADG